MKCLVAEQSVITRRIIVNVLRKHGCTEIVEAASGSQALELCDSDTTLVITAFNSPDMDGVELAQKLRAFEATSRIRILVVTPRNTSEDVQRARDAGVDGYVLKPVDVGALERQIDRLLGQESSEQAA